MPFTPAQTVFCAIIQIAEIIASPQKEMEEKYDEIIIAGEWCRSSTDEIPFFLFSTHNKATLKRRRKKAGKSKHHQPHCHLMEELDVKVG